MPLTIPWNRYLKYKLSDSAARFGGTSGGTHADTTR